MRHFGRVPGGFKWSFWVGAKAENLEMSPGKIGGFSVGSTLPETQLMGRAPKRKRCHLPSIDFQDPFGVGFRGVYTVMIVFFFDLQPKEIEHVFFPGN